jgi:hypothetical protein
VTWNNVDSFTWRGGGLAIAMGDGRLRSCCAQTKLHQKKFFFFPRNNNNNKPATAEQRS